MIPIVEPPCIGCAAEEHVTLNPLEAPFAAKEATMTLLSMLHSGETSLAELERGLCPRCDSALSYARMIRAQKGGG